MSAISFTLNAKLREDAGKGASRRLRREANLVPAIVYGGSKKPQMISLAYNELSKQLENEAFYSHIITLSIEGKSEDVIIKDLQRHPSRPIFYHADFMRVSKTKKLRSKVPLHFINEASSKGVKLQGGTVAHAITELEITCLPQDLPEFIEVDLAEMEAGHILHISDLKLPKGVESIALSHGEDHDLPVVTIHKPRAVEESEGDEEGETPAE